jgi:hypothetical protein
MSVNFAQRGGIPVRDVKVLSGIPTDAPLSTRLGRSEKLDMPASDAAPRTDVALRITRRHVPMLPYFRPVYAGVVGVGVRDSKRFVGLRGGGRHLQYPDTTKGSRGRMQGLQYRGGTRGPLGRALIVNTQMRV